MLSVGSEYLSWLNIEQTNQWNLYRSHSKFQQLGEKTRNNYRLTIMRTICLLTRLKYLKHTHKVPGALQIQVSQKQVDARDSLFKLYLDGARRSELHSVLHTLLISILHHHTGHGKLACPTDYSVCLTCLEGESDSWTFKTPSLITGQFAGLQYCFRMIHFTHCFSVAQNGYDYQGPSLPLPSANPILPETIPPTPSTTPPELPTTPPNPNSVLPEAGELDEEDKLEVVSSMDSWQLGHDKSVPGVISSMDDQLCDEDDIEIVDDEQDKGLLQ